MVIFSHVNVLVIQEAGKQQTAPLRPSSPHEESVLTLWNLTMFKGPQDRQRSVGVHITPMSLWFIDVYGIYNELVTGANLNQLITGGPHIVRNKDP